MRKLKLLLLAACALLGVNVANAYTTDDLTSAGWTLVTASSITGNADSYYMLVDCNSSAYVMANDATHYRPCYKTLANPIDNPSFVWILEGSNNTFALKSYSTGSYFIHGASWDTSMTGSTGSNTYTFALDDGKYTITGVQSGGRVGHWNDNGAAVANDGENIAANKQAKDAPGFYLYAIARSTFDAALVSARETATAGASDSEPANVTAWIQNADWSGDWGGWARSGSWGNQQWGQKTLESWNATNVIVKQELRGVPNGKYRVTADVISGPGATKAAYVFGTGSGKVASSVVSAEASANNYPTMSSEVAGKTLTADNVVVVDNTITVGVDQSTGWIVVDNFKLYYLGEDLSIYVDAYNEAVTAANNVDQNAPMLATVLAALQSAISTYGTGVDTSDKEALLTATSALTTATNNATTSIAAYAVAKIAVDKANAIKEAHNFASTTATTTFAEAIAAISDAYDAGTLSNADANAAGTTLGVSLSGWRANPNGAAVKYLNDGFSLNDFAQNLYVNTWSTEGESDGSNFKVPFYEYWTGDANSLGKITWTGTLSDLPNGQYQISAWVRVRAKNETAATAATGITMHVNEGDAVDVTEGEQIGTSQFQLGTYEAVGLVKNGMLYLNFNIADGNNISWLSIKNIKYTKLRDLTPEESFVAPTGISLDKTSVSLQTGEVVTLTATVTPDEADDKTVSWTSSDENVVTVDANGVVTTVNAGTATITATAEFGDNVTTTCTVTVTDAAAPAFYSEVAAGDFYIMNAATGKFLGGANDWGTHASIIEHGIPFTVSLSNGKYTLDSHTYNNSTDHYFNGTYVDNGATNNLYIVALGNGKYSISTADGSAFVTAWANSTYVTNEATNTNSSLAQWYFLSKNDRDKMLQAATAENPVDATYYIKEANISRNLRVAYNTSGWTGTKSYGGNDDNQCAERYKAVTDVYQEINVPNGTYLVKAQGFYRQESGDAVSYLYANDQEAALTRIEKGGINDMAGASTAFSNGEYTTELEVTVTNRTLRVGVKCDAATNWTIFDNFELYLKSYAPVTAIVASIDNDEFEVGQTAQITAATDPATASFNAITYSSSDEAIATVDANGLVTGVAAGNATITVTANEMENFNTTIDVTINLISATSEDYAALNDAITDAEAKIIGFDEGEYAPYNNAAAVALLAAAKAIDQEAVNTQSSVQAATTALAGAEWHVNATEVNAVYDGTFAAATNDGAPAGWVTTHSAGLGGAYHARTFVLTEGMSNYNNLEAFGQGDTRSAFYIRFDGTNSAQGTWYNYGKTDGYKMPLKASTTYYVKLQAGAWGDYANKNLSVTIKDGEGTNVVATTLKTTKRTSSGEGVDDLVYVFTTNDAGDYTLSFWNNNGSNYAAIVSNIEIKRATAATMTISDVQYATFVAPFAVSIPDGVTANKVTNVNGNALVMEEVTTTIPANTPVVLFKENALDATTFYGYPVDGTPTVGLLTGVYSDTEAPVGSYVLQNKNEKLGFYKVAEGKQPTVGANRAYLTVPAAEARDAFFFGDGETTAIQTLKALTEGAVEIYNLNGMKQEKLQKGTNILKMSDGSIRKVMVK